MFLCKKSIKRIKKQPKNKVFANYISDRLIIFKIYKELTQSSCKNQWAEDLHRYYPQRRQKND